MNGKALKMLFKQLDDKPSVQATDQSVLDVSDCYTYNTNHISTYITLQYSTSAFDIFPLNIKMLAKMKLMHAHKLYANHIILKYTKQYAVY